MTDDRLNAIKARLYAVDHAPNPYAKHDALEALHAHAEADLEALIEDREDLRGRLDTLAELLDAADEVITALRGEREAK